MPRIRAESDSVSRPVRPGCCAEASSRTPTRRPGLPRRAYGLPSIEGLAAGRDGEADERAHRGRLAGAVGPRKPVTVPGSQRKVMSSTATWPPKRLVRCLNCDHGFIVGPGRVAGYGRRATPDAPSGGRSDAAAGRSSALPIFGLSAADLRHRRRDQSRPRTDRRPWRPCSRARTLGRHGLRPSRSGAAGPGARRTRRASRPALARTGVRDRGVRDGPAPWCVRPLDLRAHPQHVDVRPGRGHAVRAVCGSDPVRSRHRRLCPQRRAPGRTRDRDADRDRSAALPPAPSAPGRRRAGGRLGAGARSPGSPR